MAYIPNIQISAVTGITANAYAETLEGGRRFAWVRLDMQDTSITLFHPSDAGPEEWIRKMAADFRAASDSLLSAAGGSI